MGYMDAIYNRVGYSLIICTLLTILYMYNNYCCLTYDWSIRIQFGLPHELKMGLGRQAKCNNTLIILFQNRLAQPVTQVQYHVNIHTV